MLAKVKLALRISHNYLDSDITDAINAARAELVRSGVPFDVSQDDTNPAVTMFIKTYCRGVFAKDTDTAEAFEESWKYQADNIRKSEFDVPYVTADDEDTEEGDSDV